MLEVPGLIFILGLVHTPLGCNLKMSIKCQLYRPKPIPKLDTNFPFYKINTVLYAIYLDDASPQHSQIHTQCGCEIVFFLSLIIFNQLLPTYTHIHIIDYKSIFYSNVQLTHSYCFFYP